MKCPKPGWGFPVQKSFIANIGGTIVAFRNSCPHMGARFCEREELVSLNGRHIRCPLHGALFDTSGLCVRGPCRGERLSPDETLLQELLAMPAFNRETP